QDYWDLGARQAVSDLAKIGEVVPGGPAMAAGVKPGDIVVSLQGQSIASWDDLADAISKRAGQPTELGIKLGDGMVTITVTPAPTGPDGKGRIGISHAVSPGPGAVFVRSNPLVAVKDGALKTWEWTYMTVKGMFKLLTAQLAPSNIGGPIQIAAAAGEQARHGVAHLTPLTPPVSPHPGPLQ